MKQRSLFAEEIAYDSLEKVNDPLVRIEKAVDWSIFEQPLKDFREGLRQKDSLGGRKPSPPLLMFKILVLQALYNLSDDAMEFQVRERFSFRRFLGLSLEAKVPDAKTIWLFREQLTKAELMKPLFDLFDGHIRKSGFEAKKGQIVDASIVKVPIQRNKRDENRKIKDGEPPEDWPDNKRSQKDTDARWTKKNGKSSFGYKNHIEIDSQNKIIRKYSVTEASVHDSNVFEELIDPSNSSKDVYADSAYRSHEKISWLEEQGYRPKIQRKGYRGKPITWWERQGNRTRSKVRSRVEHVFGAQAMKAGNLIVRAIGKARASTAIGLRNLAYNIVRFSFLMMKSGAISAVPK